METTVKFFDHPQFGTLRTVVIDKKLGDKEVEHTYFVGKDVAEALGYKDTKRAIYDHVDERDKTTVLIQHPGSNYKSNAVVISISGVIALTLGSKLPEAVDYKFWVTSEVLPQVHTTGGYIPIREEDDDQTIMARALKIMEQTLARKEQLIDSQRRQLREQRPLVEFAEAVSSCPDSILVRDLAKLITQNGVNIGAARLFYWLRLKGYLFQREVRPIQKWVEQGLFDTKVVVYDTHGGRRERLITRVTGKGQRYFIEGFLSGRFSARNGEFH